MHSHVPDKPPLTGLIAAAYTPFRSDGDVHLAGIDRMGELFLAAGVSGVFVCGTTGECLSLTCQERMCVAERWLESFGERLPVVVHVGGNSIVDAQTLAAHAQRCGAWAVAAMAPCFFRPASVEELIDFLVPIAAAAGDLPFYFYDIPSMTGVHFPSAAVLSRGAERIPNLAGAKYTDNDLMAFQECLALPGVTSAGGRLDMLFGKDEMLLAALTLGARGAVGSTYNYAAPVYLRIIEAFQAGDLETARREQQKSVQLVRALLQPGVVPAGKEIMKMIGIDCGQVRRPLRPLQPEETQRLYRAIKDLDVFSAPLSEPTTT